MLAVPRCSWAVPATLPPATEIFPWELTESAVGLQECLLCFWLLPGSGNGPAALPTLGEGKEPAVPLPVAAIRNTAASGSLTVTSLSLSSTSPLLPACTRMPPAGAVTSTLSSPVPLDSRRSNPSTGSFANRVTSPSEPLIVRLLSECRSTPLDWPALACSTSPGPSPARILTAPSSPLAARRSSPLWLATCTPVCPSSCSTDPGPLLMRPCVSCTPSGPPADSNRLPVLRLPSDLLPSDGEPLAAPSAWAPAMISITPPSVP
mmetsp:Transcript_19908/g.55368  ORF Transcript_19908/g.55368 Transcript_19908/m.55368 type:complete len:263 (+) Transcript_19908:372-1160(+)